MSPESILLVGGGAFIAGAMNAMAGGGTFFSFPALLAAGVPPVMANASNAVALWPASISSAWAYRKELARHRGNLVRLCATALAGGLCGALLLLAISNAAFARLIPWLLLIATLLFAFSGPIGRHLASMRNPMRAPRRHAVAGVASEWLVATYGGFFGAGMGILMLASLAIQGVHDVQEQNALKNALSAIIYTISALTFILAGAISWPHTLLMLATAIPGGYAGAALARRMAPAQLKRFIVCIGAILTAVYFFKTP